MLPERNAENMSDRTTQMLSARAGIITKEIAAVAEAEQRTADFILERVADGRIVIPANIMHKNLIPMGIGRELTTKINANIGTSPLSGCAQTEKQKLADAIRYGADTVMDLSTGGNIARIREIIIEALANEKFVSSAPAQVVADTRSKLAELEQKAEETAKLLAVLSK